MLSENSSESKLQCGRLLRISQVQEILGLSRAAIHNLVVSGQLRRRKIGGAVRIAEADLNDFVNEAAER